MAMPAGAYTVDFPAISGATVFGSGQTFSFATGGSIWDVTVTGVAHGFTPVWGTDINDTSKQVLSNTNLPPRACLNSDTVLEGLHSMRCLR